MKTSNRKPNKADKSLQGIDKSMVPVSSNKTPFNSWKHYQTSITPIQNWFNQYSNQATVGIITGSVRQNLESIDIDVKNDCNNCLTKNGIMQ